MLFKEQTVICAFFDTSDSRRVLNSLQIIRLQIFRFSASLKINIDQGCLEVSFIHPTLTAEGKIYYCFSFTNVGTD